MPVSSEQMLDQVIDRTGSVAAQLTWRGEELLELVVPGAIVHGAVIEDLLLGRAHAIDHPASDAPGVALPQRRATTMSALTWSRPTQIPAIAAPGVLQRGAGASILNTIARLAARARVPALRYAGPYPTSALWHSIRRSFRTSVTEETFTADVLGRAARLARDELPFDFVPAPHERVVIPRGHVELRDGLERAVIDGIGYEPGGSPARLVEHEATWRAEIWFGDAPWAHVATLSREGALLDGPHPVPPCTSEVVGREFPLALRTAIADLVAEVVPTPLASDARAVLVAQTVRWADLGARAATREDGGFAVHAALWQRVAPFGLGRLALALAEALAPVVVGAIVADMSRLKPPT
jgi:hypothetical protein